MLPDTNWSVKSQDRNSLSQSTVPLHCGSTALKPTTVKRAWWWPSMSMPAYSPSSFLLTARRVRRWRRSSLRLPRLPPTSFPLSAHKVVHLRVRESEQLRPPQMAILRLASGHRQCLPSGFWRSSLCSLRFNYVHSWMAGIEPCRKIGTNFNFMWDAKVTITSLRPTSRDWTSSCNYLKSYPSHA